MPLFDPEAPAVIITRKNGRIIKCVVVDQKAGTRAELPITGFGYIESFGADAQHSVSLNVYSFRVRFEEEGE